MLHAKQTLKCCRPQQNGNLVTKKNMTCYSSPHSKKTLRWKSGVLPTWHLAERTLDAVLQTCPNKTDAFIIKRNTYDIIDPNAHAFSLFKQSLRSGQSHHIDLHEMRDDHNLDIAIGFGSYVDSIEKMVTFFKDKKFKVNVNTLFKASKRHTVTKFIEHTLHIPAIQLEIATRVLQEKRDWLAFFTELAVLFEHDNPNKG